MPEPPKSEKRGNEPPKSEKRGAPSIPGSGACAPGDSAVKILQTAANLCGFLVVAVVAPMGGGAAAPECSGPSAQKLALIELRRKAELRDMEARNSPSRP
jgi:hypothetical protein